VRSRVESARHPATERVVTSRHSPLTASGQSFSPSRTYAWLPVSISRHAPVRLNRSGSKTLAIGFPYIIALAEPDLVAPEAANEYPNDGGDDTDTLPAVEPHLGHPQRAFGGLKLRPVIAARE
jgi:hypothetical protein